MKIFDKEGKINFVDKNNVLVGFDMPAQCCEDFGWFISPIKEKVIKRIAKDFNLSNYAFNPDFFEEAKLEGQEGGMVIFKLVNDGKALYLHLYNSHNGYYSHGFNMNVRGKTIKEDSV